MKKIIRTGTSLIMALLMITTIFLGNLPAAKAAINPDPIVLSETLKVSKGSPFEATFDFTHDNYSKIGSVNKIIIGVSCPNSSISIGKSIFSSENNEVDTNVIIPNETHYFNYRLTIPEKYLKRIGDGAGTLRFAITYFYSDNTHDTFMVQKTIFESASSTETNSRLSVQSYHFDPSPIKEGEKFNLIFTVKNDGSTACNNVKAVLDSSTAEGISINGITDTQYISSIELGATSTITYPMICLSKMTTNNYTLNLKLSADGVGESSPFKIFVPVTGTKTDKDGTGTIGASKPQIIIESYDYGGTAVTGGKEFVLTMNIRNTAATAIENVKMTVSSTSEGTAATDTGGAFTPAKSSNTFFIPKLGGGAVIKEQIALLPKADAAPKSYGVGIAFKYEAVLDGKRESLEAQETISIPLTQPDRFEANDPDLQTPMYLGEPGQLNINYVNKGKSKIFNLSVKLDGNFTSGESNSYIGNIESGAGDTFQATLNPTAEGTLKGTATFNYEDANGATKTVVKEFSCDVVPMDNGGENGMNSEPEPVPQQTGPSPWIIWVSIAGAVVIGVVVFIIIHKKRKAKKLRLLEDNDDYDDTSAKEG